MRNCKSALHLKHHRLGILQQLTEVLQPRSTDGTVHQPVVTAQRGRHLINDTESEKTKSPRHFYKTLATNSSTILIIPLLVILIGNELLLCCAHCQYTRLRRVDDGAELRNSCKMTFQLEKITITVPHKQNHHLPNIPKFEMEIVPPWNSCGCNLPSLAFNASALTSFEISTNPLRSALNTIGVIKPRSVATATATSTASYLQEVAHHSISHPPNITHHPQYSLPNVGLHPRRIRLRHTSIRDRSRLDDKIVHRQFDALLLQPLVEACAHLQDLLHVDVGG